MTVTHRASPFRDGRLLLVDGTYYQVHISDVSETVIPALVVDAHARTDGESIDTAPVRAFESLPDADRDAVRTLAHGPENTFQTRGDEPPPTAVSGFRAVDTPIPYPDGTAGSALLETGEAWIEWDGRHYFVSVRREGEMDRQTIRYELDEIGSTQAAVRDHLVPDDPLHFTDLATDERAVMDAAIEDGYEACGDGPPPSGR